MKKNLMQKKKPDVRIKTSYDMHYLFTSGNIYEKIIPSVTAGRPFGYGLI